MKSRYTLNLVDWLAIAFIIAMTLWVGSLSSNPALGFAVYAVMSSVASRYQIHKIIRNLEK